MQIYLEVFLVKHLINMDLTSENAALRDEIARLTAELQSTKEHLKKYTAPDKRQYYEENREIIIQRVKEYKERTGYKASKEQRAEWARKAYLKRKEKLAAQQQTI